MEPLGCDWVEGQEKKELVELRAEAATWGVLRESSRVDGERSLGAQGRALPGHGLTFRPLDAGVLIVAEKEAFPAVALIAAHHVDTALLAATIALGTLVHICAGQWVVRPWGADQGPGCVLRL